MIHAPQTVRWGATVKAGVRGQTAYEIGAASWDSGIQSKNALQAAPGSVLFRSVDASCPYMFFGLSDQLPAAGDYSKVRYAFYSNQNGGPNLSVWENGTQVFYGAPPILAGDTVSVRVGADSVVRYYRGNSLVWTSALAPVFPLYVVVAFFLDVYGGQIIGGPVTGHWA